MKSRKKKVKGRSGRDFGVSVDVGPEVPEGITAAIREAAARVDFRLLPSNVRDLISTMRAYPFEARKLAGTADGRVVLSDVAVHVGEQLYRLIGYSRISQWCPYYTPLITVGSKIGVVVNRLLSRKGKMGTGYYIDGQRVSVGGKSFVHGWSRHALERLCSRAVPDWPCYLDVGCVVSVMSRGRYWGVTLSNGTPALAAAFPVLAHSWHERYARRVLGVDRLDRSKDYYYRVGYFPYVIEGDMLKCLTMLSPGFVNTPEHAALRGHKKLAWDDRVRLLKLAESMTAKDFYDGGDEDGVVFGLFAAFHRLGVPQIMGGPTKRDVAASGRRKVLTSGMVGRARGIHIDFY